MSCFFIANETSVTSETSGSLYSYPEGVRSLDLECDLAILYAWRRPKVEIYCIIFPDILFVYYVLKANIYLLYRKKNH